MPSGKTHDSIAWYCFIPFSYLCWYLTNDLEAVFIYTFAYFFSNLMFSGDLDLVSIQSKRWGIFRWIWIPYRKMIPHRSKWSHGILLGTVFRIFYLGTFLSVFYGILYFISLQYLPSINKELIHSTNKGVIFLKHQQPIYFVTIFLGLFTGATLHTTADVTVSKIKRIRKKRKKKN
ncbi:MAG: metal-binding protein, partial [Candidatus Sericytochromatia bacterium]|nr:metal-binding protein [Candidatus Sericytochromatia bacterium]